ncbi:hypothetical protein BDP81DRAFT_217744 [Colletotrichum phormii]|uniref:Uncharacterized protein n=1 Tax=Colletotrichum phormii TaxID=359342 RepID=A0AAJ0EEH8_9PEZI|nr:uncharacterized protein BDP81DRAFT_217744 [Colletotrichum phormii]KAK1637042.1 hypothetical protein BDP81DRAFT_217744 [Colletotrichum phormii]
MQPIIKFERAKKRMHLPPYFPTPNHHQIISPPLFGTIKSSHHANKRSSNNDTNRGLSSAAPNHRRSAVAPQGPFNNPAPVSVTTPFSPLRLFVTVSIDSNLHAVGLDDVSSLRHMTRQEESMRRSLRACSGRAR